MSVTLDMAAIERWAKRNRERMPRLTARAFGRAASGLKRQLKSVMKRGGDESKGVPRFSSYEAITLQIRRARQIEGRPMGGVLADPARIVAFKRGGWQIVGWPDNLAKWAINFQDAVGNSLLEDRGYRAWLHRRGVGEIPHGYIHKERPVLTPFAEHVRAHLDEWSEKNLQKLIAAELKKGAK